jgi:hypothetical protein
MPFPPKNPAVAANPFEPTTHAASMKLIGRSENTKGKYLAAGVSAPIEFSKEKSMTYAP